MFDWFRALWYISDDALLKICGTDYALYLIFLRMTSWLLFFITLFNGIIMVPIYLTGEPMPSDDYKTVDSISEMSAATVLNITLTSSKMIFTYISAIVIVPAVALFMIYKFRERYYLWKKPIDPAKQAFKDIDIASYAVEVRNLPIDEGVESLQRRIHANMLKLYPPDPITGKSAFLRARVIGDYNYLFKKSVELRQVMDELEFVKDKNREPNAVRSQVRVRRGFRCCCCRVLVDEEHHYE